MRWLRYHRRWCFLVYIIKWSIKLPVGRNFLKTHSFFCCYAFFIGLRKILFWRLLSLVLFLIRGKKLFCSFQKMFRLLLKSDSSTAGVVGVLSIDACSISLPAPTLFLFAFMRLFVRLSVTCTILYCLFPISS